MTRANTTPWWRPASRSPSGLLAIALQTMGVKARSWQGWQLPIKTSDAHGSARILDIDGDELIRRFKERGEVAVISGFQGVHPETGRITTLGRGGSDTSAVAIAAAIRADRCDIYTDVDGVYTTDPRVVPKARRLDKIAFEEMLEMASLGAKVMQVRSIELGMVHQVRDLRALVLRQARGHRSPHLPSRNPHLRRGGNHGTAGRHRHRLLQGRGADLHPAGAGQARRRRLDLRPAGRGQHQCRHDRAECLERRRDDRPHLHGAGGRLRRAPRARSTRRAVKIGYERLDSATDVAKISVIGIGMRSHAGVAANAFRALAERGINIRAITTSEIKFSLLIDAAFTELAVRTLHSLYGLDK